jgi:hypothetical protein
MGDEHVSSLFGCGRLGCCGDDVGGRLRGAVRQNVPPESTRQTSALDRRKVLDAADHCAVATRFLTTAFDPAY